MNLESEPQTGAGFATVTTARTSIGGPGLVSGPLQLRAAPVASAVLAEAARRP